MKTRKITVIFCILVLTVAFALLPGCSSNGQDGKKDDAGLSEEFLQSLKGMKVTLAWPWQVPNPAEGTDDYTMAYYNRLKSVEKELGITFEESGGRATYYNAMIPTIAAGQPMATILFGTDTYIASYVRNNIMADLTEAVKTLNIDLSDDRFNPDSIRLTNINRKQYGFYFLREIGSMIFYNKRILVENNQPDPCDLYQKGEWTFDKFAEMANALTMRKDNGTIEQRGFVPYLNTEVLLQAIFANGGEFTRVDGDGNPQINMTDPKVVRAMEAVYKWGNTDKFLQSTEGSSWDAEMNNFTDGKIAMLLGTSSTINIVYSRNMSDEFGVVPFPKGPDAKEYINGISSCNYFFIPSTYQEDASKYLYIADRILSFDEDVSLDLYFDSIIGAKITDEQVLSAFRNAYMGKKTNDATTLSNLIYGPADGGFFALSTALIKGDLTPTVAIERFSSSFENYIKDQFDGMTLTGFIK